MFVSWLHCPAQIVNMCNEDSLDIMVYLDDIKCLRDLVSHKLFLHDYLAESLPKLPSCILCPIDGYTC
eukprot:11494331-Karenia_brevis.AAC.1